MFRTRDFFLLLSAIVFLMVAIGSTILTRYDEVADNQPTLELANVINADYQAEVYAPETLAREERLQRMRQKIADSGELAMRAPVSEETIVQDVETEEVTSEEEVVATEPIETMLCPGYFEYRGAWPTDVKLEMVEGARVAYQEVDASLVVTATSGTSLPNTRKDVLLELPVRSFSSGQQNCLSSDVVGVAQDGSLIRNVEAGLYSVFGDATVVGFSLDGFPIHGLTTQPLDACGGAVVNGQYGYYLSAERDMVVDCFSAAPAQMQ